MSGVVNTNFHGTERFFMRVQKCVTEGKNGVKLGLLIPPSKFSSFGWINSGYVNP
jgi:hypothetical protein